MATRTRMLPSIMNIILTEIPSAIIILFFQLKSWVLGQIRQRRNIRRSEANATQNYTAIAIASPILELPDPIMCDILSRLPLNSIFVCRRVCKVWRDLLLEPHFAKLHHSRSPLSLFFYCNGYIEILEINDPPLAPTHKATIKFRTAICFPHIFATIAASCNGSFLVWNSPCDDEIVVVCNPLREQHFVLPKPRRPAPRTGTLVRLGLGLIPSTHQYKVLRLTCFTSRPARLYCEIYTIGVDDEWRRIGTGQTPARFFSELVFLNGALHWIGGIENSRCICYFDVQKEQFGSIAFPSEIEICCSHLGVVDNRLYLLNQCMYDQWKFWTMEDYKFKGVVSWINLEWTFKRPLNCRFDEAAKPLKTLKDGSLLMMFNVGGLRTSTKTILASYNPRTGLLKEIEYGGIVPWGATFADHPCFFSPMDAPKQQCLSVFGKGAIALSGWSVNLCDRLQNLVRFKLGGRII